MPGETKEKCVGYEGENGCPEHNSVVYQAALLPPKPDARGSDVRRLKQPEAFKSLTNIGVQSWQRISIQGPCHRSQIYSCQREYTIP